ncbi:MAG: hypothetical protein KDC54_23510, partial [Lewinella sp.]|nr:hypothetical protein [Lewinella sp.]
MGWRFRQADTLTTDPFETVNNLWGSQIIGIRSVDVDAGGRERFRLGLIDADRDGRYHTIGTDQVILSEYGRDSAAIDPYLPSQGPLKSQTFIQVNRETYLLLDIDSLGRSVQLIPWEGRPPTDPTARLKTFLGKVPVQTLAGEPTYLQLS